MVGMMTLQGALLVLIGILLTTTVSVQGPSRPTPSTQEPTEPSSTQEPTETPKTQGPTETPKTQKPTDPPKTLSTQQPSTPGSRIPPKCSFSWICGITGETCNLEDTISCHKDIKLIRLDLEQKDGRTVSYNCNSTTCVNSTSSERCPATDTPITTISKTHTAISSSSPTTKLTTENSSTLPVAAHGGYIVVILVLLAIIIILGILLVKRTTPQRGPVQTTHQPLTDMPPAAASTAGDYCTPIALKQLQTSIGTANNSTEVYSEPVDTLSRQNSTTNTQSSPSCHFTRSLSYDVNPSYDGVALCNVNPSYSANNSYAVIQPPYHPPLPDPPTAADDSNTEYTKPVQMDALPQLAENDYEVVKEIRKEKPQRD